MDITMKEAKGKEREEPLVVEHPKVMHRYDDELYSYGDRVYIRHNYWIEKEKRLELHYCACGELVALDDKNHYRVVPKDYESFKSGWMQGTELLAGSFCLRDIDRDIDEEYVTKDFKDIVWEKFAEVTLESHMDGVTRVTQQEQISEIWKAMQQCHKWGKWAEQVEKRANYTQHFPRTEQFFVVGEYVYVAHDKRPFTHLKKGMEHHYDLVGRLQALRNGRWRVVTNLPRRTIRPTIFSLPPSAKRIEMRKDSWKLII